MDVLKEEFEVVAVLNHPMLFTCLRVNRECVPDGLHVYDVRHDDDQQGLPVQIAKWVLVNHWGTLISDKPLDLIPNQAGTNAYLDIDPEEDWNYEGFCMTVQEYMEQPPCID